MISRTFRKPFHVFFMPKNLSSHHIYKCILSLKTQRKIKSKVQSWSIPPLYLSSQAVYWLQPDEDGSKGKKCLNKDNYKLGIFLLQVMFVHLLRGHKLEPLEELPKIPVRDKNYLIQLRDMYFVFVLFLLLLTMSRLDVFCVQVQDPEAFIRPAGLNKITVVKRK